MILPVKEKMKKPKAENLQATKAVQKAIKPAQRAATAQETSKVKQQVSE